MMAGIMGFWLRGVCAVCLVWIYVCAGGVIRGEESEDVTELTVRGEVVTGEGKPLGGATVQVVYERRDANYITLGHEVREMKADGAGKFSFEGLPVGNHLHFYVRQGSFSLAMVHVLFSEPVQSEPLRIVMLPARKIELQVTDPAGKPVKGAFPKQLEWDGANGEALLLEQEAKLIDFALPRSDEAGKLEIAFLPAGKKLKGYVWHGDFAREAFVISATGEATQRVRMSAGERFTLRITGLGVEVPKKGLALRMGKNVEAYPTFMDEPIDLDEKNEFHCVLAPGKYFALLRKYGVQTLPSLFEQFEIVAGKPAEMEIALTPRGVVTGKVVESENGKPIANQMVEAFVLLPGDKADAYGKGAGWYFSGRAFTDAEGNYRITPGVGDVRLVANTRTHLNEQGFVSVTGLTMDKEKSAPEIRLLGYPTIRGVIVDTKGKPVPTGVVQLANENLMNLAHGCDTEGKFAFRMESSVRVKGTEETIPVELHAYDAVRPLGKRVKVALNLRKKNDDLRIVLEPEKIASRARSTAGKEAPELVVERSFRADGTWPKIKDQRGKFVLVHFWATWCGPCKQRMPQVELAERVFRDHGLVVIGVHHNSVPVASVEAFLKKNGPRHVTVLDTVDGETCRRYGVEGFPTYVLIGPEGTILHTSNQDAKLFWREMVPMLREYLADQRSARE